MTMESPKKKATKRAPKITNLLLLFLIKPKCKEIAPVENNHFTMVPLFFGAEGTFQDLNEMQVMLDEEDRVTSEKTSALTFEVTSNLLDSFFFNIKLH